MVAFWREGGVDWGSGCPEDFLTTFKKGLMMLDL